MASGKTCVSLGWVLLFLALVLVSLRLVFHRRKGLDVSDVLVVVGWLFFLGQTCMDTVLYNYGRYEGKINPTADAFGPERGLATYEKTVSALKIYFVEDLTYYCGLYSLKAALLILYYRLVPRVMVNHRRVLHFMTGFTAIGWLFTICVNIFGCSPIRSQWQLGKSYCVHHDWEWNTIAGLHIVGDFMLYILPLFFLHDLDLQLPQKLGVALIFSMGFLCIIFATLKQVSFQTSMSNSSSSIFASLEQTWSIIVVCLPAFKRLLTGEMWTGVSKVRSRRSIGKKNAVVLNSNTSDPGTDLERLAPVRSLSITPKHKPLPVSMIQVVEESVDAGNENR